MKYQLWEEDKPVRYIEAYNIRFDGGVFFVHKEMGAAWEWDQAFTLKAGQFLITMRDDEETT